MKKVINKPLHGVKIMASLAVDTSEAIKSLINKRGNKMDMELKEVIAVLKGKLSFKEFTERYFAVQEIDGRFFNIDREELNYRTAVEFYDDYISSGREFNQYVEETNFEA